MSELYQQQFVDPKKALIRSKNRLVCLALDSAAPSNSTNASGYEPGCLWINTGGSAGSALYGNQGTSTAASWVNIL